MELIITGLRYAAVMLWDTLWALVLGFGISAALQVLVSRDQMTRAFGRANLRSMLAATGLGAASSSCSYAAVATARSAFQKGAALPVALAFMFASTNLVIELGTVLWILLGWQFVAAEIFGSFVLIGTAWLMTTFLFPRDLESAARAHNESESESCHHEHAGESPTGNWPKIANAFFMDWSMLWKEILAGFLIAGILSAVVPTTWWKTLFIESNYPVWRLIENAAVGPLIAMASFVCSVGNIPLARLLWANGIGFGGVISFIYGDLIVLPIIVIYWKYYGGRAAWRIALVLYLSMVVAGIAVDLVFAGLGLIPTAPAAASVMEDMSIKFNYTTWLNLVAIVFAAWLLFLRSRSRSEHVHCH